MAFLHFDPSAPALASGLDILSARAYVVVRNV